VLIKSACVGVLSIIELKNARWNIEIAVSNEWNNVSSKCLKLGVG